MRNVKQDLANFSGESVGNIKMDNLNRLYGRKAAAREEFDRKNEGNYRDDPAILEQMMSIVAKALDKDVDQPQRGNLPVTSVFDALQVLNSHKLAKNDFGINALRGHLETKWKRNREANITADDFTSIKEHYSRNYPRSAVNEVIDEIGRRGYITLPLSDLVHIASKVRNQNDFDRLMKDNGLHTNQPHHVKARNFILSVVNKEI